MDQQETKPMVLARIPDLNAAGHKRPGGGSPPSNGRVIGQAFSFKLLAVAVVLLVGMAIVPFTWNRSSQSPDPSTMANPLPDWFPNPSALSADAAPASTAPVAEAPAHADSSKAVAEDCPNFRVSENGPVPDARLTP